MTLAAGTNRSERERVVCPSALRRELIWDTHKQAHAGAAWVTRCLQLQWFWPRRRRPTHQKTCQSRSHHHWSRPTGLSPQARWEFLKFMRRHHPYWWAPSVLATPPVVVESPAAANSPVQLERSQRTRAPPSYLRDFWCDLVEMHSIL